MFLYIHVQHVTRILTLVQSRNIKCCGLCVNDVCVRLCDVLACVTLVE